MPMNDFCKRAQRHVGVFGDFVQRPVVGLNPLNQGVKLVTHASENISENGSSQTGYGTILSVKSTTVTSGRKTGETLLIRKVLADRVRERMNARFPLGPDYRSLTAQVNKLWAVSGVSPRTIKEILHQTRGTSIDSVEKLARAFNCHWCDLLKE